jgi:glycosyltransferase involved in cell wall biosynthesis
LFLITTTDFGGTESILLELVRRMTGGEHEVSVCSLCPLGQIGHEIEAAGVTITTLGMSANPSFRELAVAAIRLARMLDRERIDLVQSFLYRANVVATLAVKMSRRRPRLVSGQRSLNPAGFQKAARAVKWTRRFSDVVVAVSEAVRDEVLASERTPPERVIVIRNGVDTSVFTPVDGTRARAQLGLTSDAFVVGGVGRLAPVKGFQHLIDAAGVLERRGVEIDVLLVGDGPDREELRQRAAAANLAKRVHFLGVRRDLTELYATMDVFALPSVQEGSPNALLEAMACARPIVASLVGGVPEIVVDGGCGLLTPAGDVESLADALVRVKNDVELRGRLGAAARIRVEEAYDIAQTVVNHSRLYARLIGSRIPTGPRP